MKFSNIKGTSTSAFRYIHDSQQREGKTSGWRDLIRPHTGKPDEPVVEHWDQIKYYPRLRKSMYLVSQMLIDGQQNSVTPTND